GTTKICTNAFAKSGLHEIVIPDAVTTIDGDAFAYCDALRRVVIGSKMKTMGQGVFYNSAVKDAYVKALTPPSISAYLFSSNPTIHVYARALAAYQASAWAEFGTLVGDLDEYEVITAVEQIPQRRVVSDDAVIYDLSGRSVGRNQPAGIYIRRGKKIFVKP
ncbi:MAG: leucine-rich repeat protein, partial [Bacteroidaceae bacterium]|nr:leucine-rich repeat protein [Bacteroidaceae bacterium]